MKEIRLISTSKVQTAATLNGESIGRIELTPWDLQLLPVGPIQKGLLLPKPTPSQQKALQPSNIVDHLKLTFSRTLEYFPLLAGRLGPVKNDDQNSSFFIECNNAGAHFVHAIADNVTVADILNPTHVPRVVHSFFPLNGVCNYRGSSEPLLAVQVTELDDGYFIGCTMNHTVADGSSFWLFFNS